MADREELFLQFLAGEVTQAQARHSLTAGQAFMMWYGIEALGLEEDEAIEAVSYDGGNDKSIDLFFVDEEFERVIVVQGKYQARGKYRGRVKDVHSLSHSVVWLGDAEALHREGRADLAGAAREYSEAAAKGYSVELQYVFCGPKSTEVSIELSLLNGQDPALVGARKFTQVDLGSLIQAHEEYIDVDTRIESEDVQLVGQHPFEERGPFGRALVGTLSGAELQRLYDRHGMRLFDRNVRLFLGARKGGINATIRDTLDSPKERKNFWAYNNGVTFICEHYHHDEATSRISIRNFSIVNGCQTTVSIGTAPPAAAAVPRVLTRFIESSRRPIVDAIIRFTNSQTPIKSWDLASQERNQKRIREELARAPHPFFYELRRGEARRLNAKDKVKFTRDGRLQVIRYPVLAQYLAAFDGQPAVAYKSKALLFSTHKDTTFPRDLAGTKVVFCWQAGAAAGAAVSARIRELDPNQADDMRILRRGGQLFVLSVMGILLSKRNGTTFLGRISPDVAGSKRTAERLSKYAQLAVLWYVRGMKSSILAGQDLLVQLRSPETYPKIRQTIVDLWEQESLAVRWRDEVLPMIR